MQIVQILMSQYQVRHTITAITIPGVPHNVQGGVQANVQLPTVLQERPPAEVWIQEEMLNQVKVFWGEFVKKLPINWEGSGKQE